MSAIALEGFLIGLAVAAPFGPISLLCVQRALMSGLVAATACAAGAALAHGIFATIGAVWFQIIGTTMVELRAMMAVLSGFFFIYLGARIVWRRSQKSVPIGNKRSIANFTSTFLLALCNPLTILPYFGIALSLGKAAPSKLTAVPFVIGAMCGALLWYGFIITVASSFRRAIGAFSDGVNIAAGSLFMLLGGIIIFRS